MKGRAHFYRRGVQFASFYVQGKKSGVNTHTRARTHAGTHHHHHKTQSCDLSLSFIKEQRM